MRCWKRFEGLNSELRKWATDPACSSSWLTVTATLELFQVVVASDVKTRLRNLDFAGVFSNFGQN